MRNSLEMMWRERTILVVMILMFLLHQICATNNEQEQNCPPSSCGKIFNISYPFRLKGDPKGCGDNRYELTCENNVAVLYLYSGKYNVQAINYNNFTIRVVDTGLQQSNCSSLPHYFLSRSNFSHYTDTDPDDYSPYLEIGNQTYPYSSGDILFKYIVFLNCTHRVQHNRKYVDTAPCFNNHGRLNGKSIQA